MNHEIGATYHVLYTPPINMEVERGPLEDYHALHRALYELPCLVGESSHSNKGYGP